MATWLRSSVKSIDRYETGDVGRRAKSARSDLADLDTASLVDTRKRDDPIPVDAMAPPSTRPCGAPYLPCRVDALSARIRSLSKSGSRIAQHHTALRHGVIERTALPCVRSLGSVPPPF